MKRALLLLSASLACGGDSAPEDPGLCVTLDPATCREPLPATDPEGQPWPLYATASAELDACGDPGYWSRSGGTCADGKRFLAKGGGFSGATYFYEGEALVGVRRWSDVISIECGGCTPDGQGDVECEVIGETSFDCTSRERTAP
jgi:hypothetical protein